MAVFEKIHKAPARALTRRGKLDLSEGCIDVPFVSAKKGFAIDKPRRGKGGNKMVLADRAGLPDALAESAASTADNALVEPTLADRFVPARPRVTDDGVYNRDGHDARIACRGFERIAPYGFSRRRFAQDGRPLSRDMRRGKIERTNA